MKKNINLKLNLFILCLLCFNINVFSNEISIWGLIGYTCAIMFGTYVMSHNDIYNKGILDAQNQMLSIINQNPSSNRAELERKIKFGIKFK